MTSTAVREPKDFGDSSPDDPCGACGHALRAHPWDKVRGSTNPERDKLVRLFRTQCLECARLEEPSVSWVHDFVPMGSASSSPDETCVRCTHLGSAHDTKGCHPDPGRHECNCHTFVPADAETAGEPEAPDAGCIRDAGCRDIFHGCLGGCDAAADELTRLGQEMQPEPEAPECNCACHVCDDSPCDDCAGADLDALLLPCPEGGDCRRSVECPDGCRRLIPEGPVSIPPRPPFLVAYATGSGALNELALPGEASVAVVDGSLVISHASGVLGIQHVKPWTESSGIH